MTTSKHPLELAWEALADSAARKDAAIMRLTGERNETRAEVERLLQALRDAADAPCSHCEYPPAHGQRNTAHFIADQVSRSRGLGVSK